jgi:hypothetical protein
VDKDTPPHPVNSRKGIISTSRKKIYDFVLSIKIRSLKISTSNLTSFIKQFKQLVESSQGINLKSTPIVFYL